MWVNPTVTFIGGPLDKETTQLPGYVHEWYCVTPTAEAMKDLMNPFYSYRAFETVRHRYCRSMETKDTFIYDEQWKEEKPPVHRYWDVTERQRLENTGSVQQTRFGD